MRLEKELSLSRKAVRSHGAYFGFSTVSVDVVVDLDDLCLVTLLVAADSGGLVNDVACVARDNGCTTRRFFACASIVVVGPAEASSLSEVEDLFPRLFNKALNFLLVLFMVNLVSWTVASTTLSTALSIFVLRFDLFSLRICVFGACCSIACCECHTL